MYRTLLIILIVFQPNLSLPVGAYILAFERSLVLHLPRMQSVEHILVAVRDIVFRLVSVICCVMYCTICMRLIIYLMTSMIVV